MSSAEPDRDHPVRPSSSDLRVAAHTVSRLLGIGTVALLGAAMLHGTPSPAAVRRGACAVVGCAAPTVPSASYAAGRGIDEPPTSRHP